MKTSMGMAVLVSALIAAVTGAHAQARGPAAGERFVLSGVIVYEGGGGLAYLREPSITGDRSVAVRVSESIGPYRLTKIYEDRVELEGPAGTVLVPVYNAQAGPGPSVASGGPTGPTRVTPADGGAAVAAAAPRPVGPQMDPNALRTLRDRMETARRQVELSQTDPKLAELQYGRSGRNERTGAGPTATGTTSGAASGSAAATGAPVAAGGADAAGGGAAPAGSGGTGRTMGGGASAPGGNANVIVPERRQTFQSILGLQ